MEANRYVPKNLSEVQFVVAESYKTIRTNLLFLLSNTPECKVVTISSPQAGDGKTTNAINIAIAFSQLGKKVLLLDCDLRRPTVAKRMRVEFEKGMSDLLAGFATAEETIINISENFDILPAGAIPPNPSEMLASSAMDNLLHSLREKYDFIIIDSPPLGIVSDPLVIAPKTDGIVVIVKQKATRHAELSKVLDRIKLSNVHLLGVLLNSAKQEKRYYSYKNSYKTYY